MLKNRFFNWTWGISVIAFLLVWWIASLLATAYGSRTLPGPETTLAVLIDELWKGDMLFHLFMTLIRMVASFVIAMTLGIAIGIVMGRQKKIDTFFDSWLVLFLNLPALVTIILAYVWFGLNEIAAIFAVAVNKIPNVIVTVREGARALSKDNLEMARVYKLGRLKTLRYIVLPELAPFIAAAARSGLALIWKIVLVVELFGRSNGVGFQLTQYFSAFDVAAILAYAAAFILIIQFIEIFMMQPLERRANRWRR